MDSIHESKRDNKHSQGSIASSLSVDTIDLETGNNVYGSSIPLVRFPNAARLRERQLVSETAEQHATSTATGEDIAPSTETPEEIADTVLSTTLANPRRRVTFITTSLALISIVFLANLVALIAIAVQGHLTPAIALAAVSSNIFASVLVRQELTLNFFYIALSSLPRSAPYWLRWRLANFHHVGGVHKGCAISSLIWYVAYVYFTTNTFVQRRAENKNIGVLLPINLVTCYLFILFLLAICVTATSRTRFHSHNSFERIHRFGGWAAVAIFWIHAGITSLTDSSLPLYTMSSFYFLAFTTILLIWPWLFLRRVKVTTTPLNDQAIMLSFPYKRMPPTSVMRFSISPLLEYHAFATLPNYPSTSDENAKEQSSIVIAAVGDWTRSIVANPPSMIFLRALPTYNFLVAAQMFSSVLVVATGAGIGPILSYLESVSTVSTRPHIRVLWVAKRPFEESWAFAREIIGKIDAAPVIFDSTNMQGGGRPDIVREMKVAVRTFGSDAVFVVGNKVVTDGVVNGAKELGILGVGASFDS